MTLYTLSEYDVISNFRPLVPSKMRFFCNFWLLNGLSLNLTQGFKIGCWFLFLAQKLVLGTISYNMIQKPLFYVTFFSQTPLRNSVAMATSKVPGDQKLFERECYTLILKVTMTTSKVPGDQKLFERECYTLILKVIKFQLPTPSSFWAVLKKPVRKSNQFSVTNTFLSLNQLKVCYGLDFC